MSLKEEFSSIDMATAAADGFRDGVASVQGNSAIPNNQDASASQSAPAGEAPEAVAWRMWSGKRWQFCYSDLHGKRGWEPLMTVAQHQRIVAALSAQQSEPERVSVPRELLERLCARKSGESIDDEYAARSELRALLEGKV